MNNLSPKRVVTNSVVYSISGLLTKCFSMFLLPLYTAYLTTEDYGITSIANSFCSVMSFIVALSLFSAIMRFYVELKGDGERLRRFYGTIIVFCFISATLCGVLLSLLKNPLSKYIFSGVDYYPVIFICLLNLVFSVQHTIYTNILRSQQKALKNSVLSLIYFFVSVGLNILFVVIFQLGAVGVLLSSAFTNGLFFLYFICDMIREKAICVCLDLALLKEALKYSIPIIPHNLSTHIATFVSNTLIGGTASLASLGVYSVAMQFGHLADTIQGYVNEAYAPWLYEQLHDSCDGYKKTIRSTVRMLIAVLGLFILGITLFSQDYILIFLDETYSDAWRYVPMIVFVYLVKTIYYFYVNVLFYYKKASRLLFTATLTSSIVNVLFSAFMIPLYGVYGSIIADIIAMLIRVCIVTVISLRYEDIGLHISDFVYNILIVLGFILVAMLPSYLKPMNGFSYLNFGYKSLIIIAYIGLLLMRYHKSLIVFMRRIMKQKGRSKHNGNK